MKNDLSELSSFAMVAAERSFTRAAARLGVSQSALYYPSRRSQPAALTALINTLRLA
jgi:hypothetical protein